jgi:hypothetical protein
MALSDLFGFRLGGEVTPELPELYPMAVQESEFVRSDIEAIYTKILTDVTERTQGLSDEVVPRLWDNCLASETNKGLISLLAKAMAGKQDLFLVYIPNLSVLREATQEEKGKIQEDYKKNGKSSLGIFVSFKNYVRTDMVKLWSAMEYYVIHSLNKQTNLSKAIQYKIKNLRAAVGLADAAEAKAQAKAIAEALSKGQDCMMDGEDEIVTSTPDLTAVKEAIAFLDAKRCFYLGMPLAYVNGELTTGIGSTGEADTKGVERGLKQYYYSVFKPVVEQLFEAKTTFKSQDFRMLDSAVKALQTFELVGEGLISQEEKRLIVAKLLDFDPKKLKDAPKNEPPPKEAVPKV